MLYEVITLKIDDYIFEGNCNFIKDFEQILQNGINRKMEMIKAIENRITSYNVCYTKLLRIALLTLEGGGMVGVSGMARKLFETLSLHNINVIFITQASSEHSICIGILENQAEKAKKYIDEVFNKEIAHGQLNSCQLEKDLSIIALVGDQMKNHQGLSGKMFSTLGRNNVNVRAIAQGASERIV